MKKFLIAGSLFLLIISAGCKAKKEKSEPLPKYLVTSVMRVDTSIVKDYVCQIQSIRHIEVRSQEMGYLTKINVDEGQYVPKGTLLFTIQPKVYSAELASAKAGAQAAAIDVSNSKALFEKNVVAKNDLALAQAKYSKAEAEVALAAAHYGFTTIRAPFSGIMGKLDMKLGSLVNEGDLLSTVSDNHEMWVYFNVPEAEYLDYAQRMPADSIMPVKLQMANGQIFQYGGLVRRIEADFDNETGNIAFRATFPNPNKLLRDGETGNILVTTPLNNVMVIPQEATFDVLDNKCVYVIDKQNKVQLRQIVLGPALVNLVVVNSGLQDGDRIMLEGIRKVNVGDSIGVNYQDPKYIMDHLAQPTE